MKYSKEIKDVVSIHSYIVHLQDKMFSHQIFFHIHACTRNSGTTSQKLRACTPAAKSCQTTAVTGTASRHACIGTAETSGNCSNKMCLHLGLSVLAEQREHLFSLGLKEACSKKWLLLTAVLVCSTDTTLVHSHKGLFLKTLLHSPFGGPPNLSSRGRQL